MWIIGFNKYWFMERKKLEKAQCRSGIPEHSKVLQLLEIKVAADLNNLGWFWTLESSRNIHHQYFHFNHFSSSTIDLGVKASSQRTHWIQNQKIITTIIFHFQCISGACCEHKDKWRWSISLPIFVWKCERADVKMKNWRLLVSRWKIYELIWS